MERLAKVLSGIAVAALLSAGPAASAPANRARLETIVLLEGACQKLTLPGYDFTRGCDPRMSNEAFDNGRTGFTFTIRTGAVVTFSGGAKQVKQGADTAIQPIDTMIWNSGMGLPSISQSAVGRCRFTNPYKGKATVSCTATSEKGDFAGEFLTDGATPKSRNF